MYYVHTTGTNSLALGNVSQLTSVTASTDEPAGTTLRWLVSFDGGTTWKYASGGSNWVEASGGLADLGTHGNTTSEMQTGLAGYTVEAGDTQLDFAMGLMTTDETTTPRVSGIQVDYQLAGYYESRVLGGYSSAAAEYGMQRVSSTQTKVKKLSAGSATVKVNIVTE
ncbi:MAG: hypothetical protein OMM_06132 [Candidatus Magnetoglobus multicellularis str. Araruama]|uniref:Uncharacterized protein n=1 Tax=Candidatus Magnetoglobus multicellularis str. Araruama TaxID=890399 RepID=A0A1V1NRB8_9BACT|nr:MAG: hypothetical protein OMM_06132 [Candidatus Magnetoglobus multicellularis str. Araruama]